MKIYQIYNEQRSRIGGEPAVVDVTSRVLETNGHESRLVMKSSRDLENSLLKRFGAFWTGIYNGAAYREMQRLLESDCPDIVHVHSVYPMFSPSILLACRHAGVPVVMTVHTHNLTCPTWFHLRNGKTCEKCMGGREHQCVIHNCRRNLPESIAYALRSFVARRFRLFHDNIDILMVPTNFSKAMLLRAGFAPDQVMVVPNPTAVTKTPAERPPGDYVAFAGRVSSEKGVDVLLAAAALMPHLAFKVAGDGPVLAAMMSQAPANVEFMGRLGYEDLLTFYEKARMLVVPSVWFEPFGMVAADAMALGLPVIASRIGGLPDVVEDGVTGLLFEPGNAHDLAEKIAHLWDDRALAAQLGRSGRTKAAYQYSQKSYLRNLMAVYHIAIQGRANSSALLPILT
jgi:glycosyltransferase involved in cell wall biosynthesis